VELSVMPLQLKKESVCTHIPPPGHLSDMSRSNHFFKILLCDIPYHTAVAAYICHPQYFSCSPLEIFLLQVHTALTSFGIPDVALRHVKTCAKQTTVQD
jgi:hypothetical protein